MRANSRNGVSSQLLLLPLPKPIRVTLKCAFISLYIPTLYVYLYVYDKLIHTNTDHPCTRVYNTPTITPRMIAFKFSLSIIVTISSSNLLAKAIRHFHGMEKKIYLISSKHRG